MRCEVRDRGSAEVNAVRRANKMQGGCFYTGRCLNLLTEAEAVSLAQRDR